MKHCYFFIAFSLLVAGARADDDDDDEDEDEGPKLFSHWAHDKAEKEGRKLKTMAAEDFNLKTLNDKTDRGGFDLLLVLEEKDNNRELKKSMNALASGNGLEERRRNLVVAKCLGCPEMDETLARLHLTKDQLPLAILFQSKRDVIKFMLPLKGKKDPYMSMLKFVKAFDSGFLKPMVHSAPEPEEQKGSVIEVVGSTFNDHVIDMPKHVLLLVYAGNDDSSRPVLEVFQKIGKMLSKHSKVFRVAQMAWGTNDYPPYVNLPNPPRADGIYLFRNGDHENPDHFPMDEVKNGEMKLTVDSIVKWTHDMLPEFIYGLDSVFKSLDTAVTV